jgi:hypothetical protein
MSDAVKLITTKPDVELAEELKQELAEAAKPWLEACTKAKRLGFDVHAQFVPNLFNQFIIQQLALTKTF